MALKQTLLKYNLVNDPEIQYILIQTPDLYTDEKLFDYFYNKLNSIENPIDINSIKSLNYDW